MIVTHYVNSSSQTELQNRVTQMTRTEIELAYVVLAMELAASEHQKRDDVYYKYVILLDEVSLLYKPWYNWWPCKLARTLKKFFRLKERYSYPKSNSKLF